MAMRFSDLHCHNHMRAHFWMQEQRKRFERKGQFTPWTVISSNRKGYLKGKMGASYSQTDLVKAWNGNLRLTFNSLYPLEKPFVKGFKPKLGEDKWTRFLIAFATSHKLPLRDFIQTAYMRIPDDAVDYFQSTAYDYWESLNREMEFVTMDSGKRIKRNEVFTPGLARRIFESEKNRRNNFPREMLAKDACYHIPKTREDLRASVDDDSEITMVLTIEGAHALGTDRASIAEVSRRVNYIKTQWPTPVFFITFAHHFDNKLCGHAHSIPDQGKALLDQSVNLNAGFNDNGRRILREFLGLNRKLEIDPKLGYRILIDVKHMSARARKEYYEEIVKPCLAKDDIIPIIGSHCGYSGISSLEKHIERMPKEVDDYCDDSGLFNSWNINLCDEDIEMIVKTKGLFGLSFDQRILGITAEDKESKRNGIQLLWENIEGIVKSAYANENLGDEEKPHIWKCITIGTDLEGLIDPVSPYPTVLEFELFAGNLIFEIEQARKKGNPKHLSHFKDLNEVRTAVEDFCFHNAANFVKKHYPIKSFEEDF